MTTRSCIRYKPSRNPTRRSPGMHPFGAEPLASAPPGLCSGADPGRRTQLSPGFVHVQHDEEALLHLGAAGPARVNTNSPHESVTETARRQLAKACYGTHTWGQRCNSKVTGLPPPHRATYCAGSGAYPKFPDCERMSDLAIVPLAVPLSNHPNRPEPTDSRFENGNSCGSGTHMFIKSPPDKASCDRRMDQNLSRDFEPRKIAACAGPGFSQLAAGTKITESYGGTASDSRKSLRRTRTRHGGQTASRRICANSGVFKVSLCLRCRAPSCSSMPLLEYVSTL